jgi:Ice-binding-like
VYWLVGDAASLGRESAFIGTIIAQAGISAGTDADVYGRVLARSGAVTLDSNAVEIPVCFAAVAMAPGALGAIGVAIGAGIGIGEISRKPSSPN